jgi:hypothetical protein
MSTPVNHLWRPSNARYLQIDGFVSTPRGPRIPPPQALVWPAKDPSDTLDYVFDISPALTANPGDSISTLDVQISPRNPGDLVVTSVSADGPRAVLWFSAGRPQVSYNITIAITTAAGRALTRSVVLPVMPLALMVPPLSALTTPGGEALTDPTGIPLTTI